MDSTYDATRYSAACLITSIRKEEIVSKYLESGKHILVPQENCFQAMEENFLMKFFKT